MAVTTRTGDAGTPTTAPPAPGRRRPQDRRRRRRRGQRLLARRPDRLVGDGAGAVRCGRCSPRSRRQRRSSARRGRCPRPSSGRNFAAAWDKGVGEYLLNSVIVVTGGVAADHAARLDGGLRAGPLPVPRQPVHLLPVRRRDDVPGLPGLVPLFFVVQNLGMLATYQGLILVYVAYSLPFTVFFMHAFFRTLPTSVAEAAFIDGCSHTGVVLPGDAADGQARPAQHRHLQRARPVEPVRPAVVPVPRAAGARPGHRHAAGQPALRGRLGRAVRRPDHRDGPRASSSTCSSTGRSRPA